MNESERLAGRKGADEAAVGGEEEVEEAHTGDEVQILGPDGRPAKR